MVCNVFAGFLIFTAYLQHRELVAYRQTEHLSNENILGGPLLKSVRIFALHSHNIHHPLLHLLLFSHQNTNALPLHFPIAAGCDKVLLVQAWLSLVRDLQHGKEGVV